MKTHISTLLFGLIIGTVALAQTQVAKLDANTFNKKISGKNVQLIDIRTPQEYAAGHIQSAINIDYYSATFAVEMDKFAKDKPIYIYCRSGNRTSLATEQLTKMGYMQLFDLQSGIIGWQSANLPLVK